MFAVNSSSVNEPLLPHKHIFPVNSNIIVQIIQLLGVKNGEPHSVVVMIIVYESIYTYYITEN
jgi:hypothetical protein